MPLTKVGKEGITGVSNSSDATAITIDSSEKVGIGTTSVTAKLAVSGTGIVDLGIGSTNAGGAYLYLDGDSNGDFSGSDYSYIAHDTSGQLLIHQDSPSGSDNILFKTNATERMRIDSNGTLLINKTVRTLNCVQQIAYNGGSQQGLILENTNNSQAGGAVRFVDSDGDFSGGGIFYTDSNSISYTTSSDYRLKENIVTDWDATTDLKKLKPSKFNFKKTPSKTVQGFIAHEVSSIVSEAITGDKDAVDENGNPLYQGIDHSKLVPLLTKALQEAVAKIETLEAKVTALESK